MATTAVDVFSSSACRAGAGARPGCEPLLGPTQQVGLEGRVGGGEHAVSRRGGIDRGPGARTHLAREGRHSLAHRVSLLRNLANQVRPSLQRVNARRPADSPAMPVGKPDFAYFSPLQTRLEPVLSLGEGVRKSCPLRRALERQDAVAPLRAARSALLPRFRCRSGRRPSCVSPRWRCAAGHP
jgi:hypothetical protein